MTTNDDTITISGDVGQLRFRVMGSSAHVIIRAEDDPGRLLVIAKQRAVELEASWSRFIPTSEISILNANAGQRVEVGKPTRTLIRRAKQAWVHTSGVFNPLQLTTLRGLGYDRTFADLGISTAPAGLEELTLGGSCLEDCHDRCGEIEVDDLAGTAKLPHGTAFDPGGIGKGLAADLIATELIELGAEGALVNLGGDLRAVGTGPNHNDGQWIVDVGDTIANGHHMQVALGSGAIATSTTRRRQWSQPDGTSRNHLIDPSTQTCVDNDLALVSVVAAEAWQAEALATALAVVGHDQLTRAEIELMLGEGSALVSTETATVTYGPIENFIRTPQREAVQ